MSLQYFALPESKELLIHSPTRHPHTHNNRGMSKRHKSQVKELPMVENLSNKISKVVLNYNPKYKTVMSPIDANK